MENRPLNDDISGILLALKGLDDNPKLRLPHLYNALSLLHQCLGEDSWVGLYIQEGDELFLGPFQGTPACERILSGKGVVGVCQKERRVIAVKDVTEFPGYICCDAKAKSEICVPLLQKDDSIVVLDIDLSYIHDFSGEEDLFVEVGKELNRFLG